MNRTKLESAISAFVKNKKANAAYYDDNWTERNERKAYYQSFTKDKLLAMTEEDFFEYMSRLWSMVMWGNKRFVVDKLIADNGYDQILVLYSFDSFKSDPYLYRAGVAG